MKQRNLDKYFCIDENFFKEMTILDITIADYLSDEPIDIYDIDIRLQENGIPGYNKDDIQKSLDNLTQHGESVKVRTGYVRRTEQICTTEQLLSGFHRCAKPHANLLAKDSKPKTHTYIEDGIDLEFAHAPPVPPGSRIFTRIYNTAWSKYNKEFYSHMYAFKPPNGAITPIDLWFFGHGTP